MNGFNKCFVFLELLVQLSCVVSYTVVLKQVKPFHPPIKVYRYELRQKLFPDGTTPYVFHKPLLGQRIYPVVVKPGREGNYKTRVPVIKEKVKQYKVISTTERASSKDSRLLGLSQHLVPPVSNQIEEYSEAKEEEENDDRPLPASFQSGKSFSSFGQEKGRIYGNPGDWATPVPHADSENTTKAEFTPSQLYLQIRHKNTVIHVPQSEALKDAETLEELINAPRLKELSRTTHVQETYSEEGYEDAGYDHAGHIRQAQHGEVYDAKDEGRFKIKEAPVLLDYDSDLEESKKVPLKNDGTKEYGEENLSNKLEPRTTHLLSEVTKASREYAKVPQNYKGEHKYSSRLRSPVKRGPTNESGLNEADAKELPSVQATFPSYFNEMPPTPESVKDSTAKDSSLYSPPVKKSSKYRKGDFNSTQIYPVPQLPANPTTQVQEFTDFKPYISLIDSQASPSAKSLKYSRIYSKKTKQLRLEPYKNERIFPSPPPVTITPPPPAPLPPPREILQPPNEPDKIEEEEAVNERIVLPTIGYINSLTTAYFGKENSKPPQDESKPQLTDVLNLTQALTYLRMNKNQNHQEVTKRPTEIDIRTFEPMKLKKSRTKFGKTKRDVYLTGTQKKSTNQQGERYEGDDESDLPHNEKNEEIAEDERKRTEEENREKEKYEADLKHEISNQEKKIIKETFRNIGVKDDISEVFPEFPNSDTENSSFLSKSEERNEETTPTPVDVLKYPFYLSKKLPENSPLRYATDPKQFPKKSGHKMEFYESREQLIQCPDIHPNLDDLPNSNSTEYSEEQAGENQRLTRVGDKIACLRMKYFDPEPFDNPIFKEKEIDYIGKPGKRKKIRNEIHSKTGSKRDQKSQQTFRQMPLVAKGNKKFNTTTQSLKPIKTGQPEAKQQTKPQFSPTRPKTNEARIIPVTETVDDVLPYEPFQNLSNPIQVVGWKTTYRLKHHPRVQRQPTIAKTRIVKPHNCLPHISKLGALDGGKNLTIECDDVTLIQEIIKNVARLRIIPKEEKQKKGPIKKYSERISFNQNDWVPIAGYVLPKQSAKPLSRRTDEVKLKNETSQNASSTHYVIDELKEDEKVRKGEVVEDMDHYMKLIEEAAEATTVKAEVKTENSTRRRREAQSDPINLKKTNNLSKRAERSSDFADKPQTERENGSSGNNSIISKPFERKRPLTRLSGIDFLTRYHKNKGKATTQRTEDFWKITTAGPTMNKNTPKSLRINSEIEKTPRTTSKNKESKLERTTLAPITEITSTKKNEIRRTSEIQKQQSNSSAERQNKPKIKQSNEYRKISLLNLIPEKITKRPESKNSEFWPSSTQNPEKTTAKPQNFTRIITKVSRETSESSEKPRIVYKQPNQGLTTEHPTTRPSSDKPEPIQYKTINRSSAPAEDEDSERPTENPEGPILYYVVNIKTGRGKWITNYEELIKGGSEKTRKYQKGRENSGTKREKRRKKPKY